MSSMIRLDNGDTLVRTDGLAGQISVTHYIAGGGDDSRGQWAQFVGSLYGGPVVLVVPSTVSGTLQTFVTDPERFGDFATNPLAWAKSFLFSDTRKA